MSKPVVVVLNRAMLAPEENAEQVEKDLEAIAREAGFDFVVTADASGNGETLVEMHVRPPSNSRLARLWDSARDWWGRIR